MFLFGTLYYPLLMSELLIFMKSVLFNGSPESPRWPSVGKYKVDVASFESLALPELQVGWLSQHLLFMHFVNISKLKTLREP